MWEQQPLSAWVADSHHPLAQVAWIERGLQISLKEISIAQWITTELVTVTDKRQPEPALSR